jgi:hypothetical protein
MHMALSKPYNQPEPGKKQRDYPKSGDFQSHPHKKSRKYSQILPSPNPVPLYSTNIWVFIYGL